MAVKNLKGVAASYGFAISKAYTLEAPDLSFKAKKVNNAEVEVQRLHDSLAISRAELNKIKENVRTSFGDEQAEIFSAHVLVLSDPELITPIEDKIKSEKVNAEAALDEVTKMFIDMFGKMDNAYMRERAADIKDVSKRVMAHLLNVSIPDPALISEEVVVVAGDLTPSDTAQLNKQFVKGFITNIGGKTSHSAIMARSLGIPAVVGTKTATKEIKDGDIIIVDGTNGEVIINPSTDILASYQMKLKDFAKQKEHWAELKDKPTIAKDGEKIKLAANIGKPDDIKSVLDNGGEAIGLYRTEFLYMGGNDLPTEDEQFEAYKSVLKQMENKPVVVRTLDIGGDKELGYLDLPDEMNPFLGVRGIRLCLERKDIFRTQVRALLRASPYGNLKIIFPMIATLDEFREAKALLLEEKENLKGENIDVADKIEIGIMVEIPSTAVIARQFAKEVDFFSIGTNDLIQYTMAADRMNESVSYLYQPYHPAILNLVNNVIEAAHAEGKWAGMCGEMAGDPIAIPILLGLGLDEFSMSSASILPARAQIKELSKKEMISYKDQLLSMSTAEEVEAFIREKTNKS